MIVETPLEIAFVPPKLRASFTGLVAEAVSGTPQQREDNFLSRALAAYAVHKLAACTLAEAAQSVVDGGGDGGIDAVHHAIATNTLWVIQATGFEVKISKASRPSSPALILLPPPIRYSIITSRPPTKATWRSTCSAAFSAASTPCRSSNRIRSARWP